MRVVEHTIQTLVSSEAKISKVIFSVAGQKQEIKAPIHKEKLLGVEKLAKYARYIHEDHTFEDHVLNLGEVYEHKGDLSCDICHGLGFHTEGEHDDIREVECVCISEEADFTGATEGDR